MYSHNETAVFKGLRWPRRFQKQKNKCPISTHLADADVDDLANAEHVAHVGYVLSHRRKLQKINRTNRNKGRGGKKKVTTEYVWGIRKKQVCMYVWV